MFLGRSEVEQLTGLRQYAAQRRWLTDRGWKHEVDAGGRPVVLRAEMERHMLSGGSTSRIKKLRLDKIAA